jgi:cold shock CspA family protein
VTGTVQTLGRTYGFIKADDGAELFFHDTDVVGDGDIELAVGDRVTFEVLEPQPVKGPRARAVSFLSAGNRAPDSAPGGNQ